MRTFFESSIVFASRSLFALFHVRGGTEGDKNFNTMDISLFYIQVIHHKRHKGIVVREYHFEKP